MVTCVDNPATILIALKLQIIPNPFHTINHVTPLETGSPHNAPQPKDTDTSYIQLATVHTHKRNSIRYTTHNVSGSRPVKVRVNPLWSQESSGSIIVLFTGLTLIDVWV